MIFLVSITQFMFEWCPSPYYNHGYQVDMPCSTTSFEWFLKHMISIEEWTPTKTTWVTMILDYLCAKTKSTIPSSIVNTTCRASLIV